MTQEYDPADDSKRSYDVAVDALRAKFVEDVTALREQAIERVERALHNAYFTNRDEAIAALDEVLAWLSEADLKIPAHQTTIFRAIVKGLRREMKAVAGA